MQPLVSVCLSNYNCELYIIQCLDSIAQDSYPHLEIVILDDGSSDESPQLIEQWITRHPELNIQFHKQNHQGIPKSFNNLVKHAKGKYIAWIGCDDYLIDGGIQARVDYLEQNPQYMAVFGDAKIINENGEVLQEKILFTSKSLTPETYNSAFKMQRFLIWNWNIPGPVLMVNRNIYKKIGYYNESYIFEDLDFYWRMSAHNLLRCIDTVVSVYRIHKKNSCATIPGFEKIMSKDCKTICRNYTLLKNGFYPQIAMLIWLAPIHHIYKILFELLTGKRSFKQVFQKLGLFTN